MTARACVSVRETGRDRAQKTRRETRDARAPQVHDVLRTHTQRCTSESSVAKLAAHLLPSLVTPPSGPRMNTRSTNDRSSSIRSASVLG